MLLNVDICGTVVLPQLEQFFVEMNYYFVFMFVILLYGIKNTDQMDWFKNILKKFDVLKYDEWIMGVILMLSHTLFRLASPDKCDYMFFAELFRSYIFAVVFGKVFVGLLGYFLSAKVKQARKKAGGE